MVARNPDFLQSKNRPEIIRETADWIAINKPAGLPSIPDREGRELSARAWLQDKYGPLLTVHRIDKDTSGLLLFARNEHTHRYLSGQFEERAVQKTYLGLVAGKLSEDRGIIDQPLMAHPARKGRMIVHPKGKPSQTQYELLEVLGPYSWIRFRILTGRQHQIRVHMQYLGHPIVCDPLYGDGSPVLVSAFKRNYNLSRSLDEERPILRRQALHAYQLSFADGGGQLVSVEAPLPRDLKALLQQLHKHAAKK